MTHPLKDNIILPAWKMIQEDSRVKKFYLFPGLLSIIFLSALLAYQSIYTYVEIFGKQEETLEIILKFLHSDYITEALVTAGIFLIVYFICSPIYEGGLIRYIDSKKNGKDITAGEAFGAGLYRFFPVFEYNNVFSEFKFISIVNFYLFTIRFVGVEFISIVSYIFLVIFFFSVIINTLFAYAKYFIVIENKNMFKAIGASSKVAIFNLRNTFRLYILMFILNIRVIFNFIVFLIFPIIMALAITFITSTFFLTIAIIILSILFLGVIGLLGYLTAVLEVFKTSLWYFAYIEGKNTLEKIKEND